MMQPFPRLDSDAPLAFEVRATLAASVKAYWFRVISILRVHVLSVFLWVG